MLAPQEIRSAFNLPPRRAIEFFAAKTNVPSWRAADIWQEAHRKAFTVAKVMRGDILQDIRDSVSEVFTEGYSEDIFMKRLMPKLKAKGWWGKQTVEGPSGKETVQLGSPWRLRNILRTNTVTSRSAGTWRAHYENRHARPYLQYLATLDAKTRPSHRAMHGKVFRIDDPIWRWLYPPNDWGCRCRVRALNDDDLKRMGLKVSLGGKYVTFEDRVDPSTGEVRQVAVYTDPKTKERMATGIGWSYNPGLEDHELDLGKMDIDLVQEVKAGIKRGGLVHRMPVNSAADVEKLLKVYDEENPGMFLHGVKRVTIERDPSYIMATDTKGHIFISSAKMKNGKKPSEAFFTAVRKIANDENLTFDEEYMIEGLWHEIGHNRQRYIFQRLTIAQTNLMETLNQWVARKTYPDFLAALGGEAKHQTQIMTDGHGYRNRLRNWQVLLARLGVSADDTLSECKRLTFDTSFEKLYAETAAMLHSRATYKPKADAVLNALHSITASESDFVRRLDAWGIVEAKK